MKAKTFFLCLIVFALAAAASAQTKILGTHECAKPDQEYSIQVGDRPSHSFVISQGKCTWTKPMEIAGIQNKELVDTSFAEVSGKAARIRVYVVDTMANGDKGYYRVESTLVLKEGVPQSGESKFTAVGGTGKLKGIKAKGSCKLTSAAADGSATYECEGEYELPK
jgi:hypothetical protein